MSELEYVLVRYGEIGTKSRPVRNKMIQRLRERVEGRLEHDSIDFDTVSVQPGRIIVETVEATESAESAAEVPGVSSTSPALKTDAEIEEIEEASEEFSYGDSFGVRATRSGEHEFGSQEVNERIGSHIQDFSGSTVDLVDPSTRLGVDIRFSDAYLFTRKIEGPGGYPVGSQEPLAALISGGIDSPVAAYQVMKRGAPILPIYFYNRPVAAEDHWLRFKASVKNLKKYHPGKNWKVFRIDMGEVNKEIMDVDRGRMLLHRTVMFRTAGKIADREGLAGIVTGESMAQKSSQTAANLDLTSRETSKPVHRPLLSWNKNSITEVAREMGTFKDSTVASACKTLAPGNPATSMAEDDFEQLKKRSEVDRLVEEALSKTEEISV